MRIYSKIFITLISLLIMPHGALQAQDSTPENNNASEIKNVEPQIVRFPDFVRFNFKSDEYISFDPVIDGTMLIIDFEQANNMNLSNLVGKTSLLKSFGISPDNKSMVIRLNSPGIKLRKFIGDDFTTGIDIFMNSNIAEIKNNSTIMMSDIPENDQTSEEEIIEEEPQKLLAESDIITYPLDFVGPPRINQLYLAGSDFIGPLQEDFHKTTIYEIIKTHSNRTVEMEIAQLDDGIIILFPFTNSKEIGSATKYANNKITIIFDKKKNAVIPDLESFPIIKEITHQNTEETSRFDITLDEQILNESPTEIITYRNKYSWVVELSQSNNEESEFVVKPIKVEVNNEWGENTISIKAENLAGPFKIKDENTGNDLHIFTIKDNGRGILLGREFVDLKINESLQGLFIKEKSDFLSYKIDNDKLTIKKLPNLIISEEIIATDFSAGDNGNELISKTMGIFPEQSVFPFTKALAALEEIKKNNASSTQESTNNDDNESNEDSQEDSEDSELFLDDGIIEEISFSDTVINKLDNILKATEDETRSDEKLNLANFYFSKGMYPESLGILYDIMISDAGYNNILKVRSTYAATLYLTKKYQESYDAFTQLVDESLNNSSYNEFKLWKWFSLQKRNEKLRIRGEPNIKMDFVSSHDKFMQQYDDETRFNFGYSYIIELINNHKIEDAKSIFDIVTYSGYPEERNNDAKFLRAKLQILDNNSTEALKALNELIQDVDDRKNRARALFEITKYNLINGISSTEQAIDKFMLSSTIWRDNYFEMDVYETVGNLYLAEKDYLNALNTWKDLVANFPQTTESLFILGKMKEVFIELFDGGTAYDMDPLEALRIYFKYRELMPSGEVGDRIARKIANFFLKADMIEDAIDIILHQIKYRSIGEEKAKLVLWLSNIYINNRDLISAEDVLNIAKEEEKSYKTSDLIRYQRAYIKAKRELYREGMDLINGDFSDGANKSRIELFWVRENWFGLTQLIEEKLDSIKETEPEPLTDEELSYIIKLAISYSAQGKDDKIQALKDDFMSRIKNEEDIKLLEYLSSGNPEIDYKNFQETLQLENIERFINEYSFLPNQSWENIIEVLEPKMAKILTKIPDDFTRQDKFDIVRLALAYTLLKPEDLKLEQEIKKKLNNLARDFKTITIDRFSIDALTSSLDDKFTPIENDATFEGKIKLTDITRFLSYYKKAKKMSKLNISIRDKF